MPRRFAHASVLPARDLELVRDLERFLADGLAEAQGEAGRGIRNVLAENQNSIGRFGVFERSGTRRSIAHDIEHQSQQVLLSFRHTVIETLSADQRAQGEIGF